MSYVSLDTCPEYGWLLFYSISLNFYPDGFFSRGESLVYVLNYLYTHRYFFTLTPQFKYCQFYFFCQFQCLWVIFVICFAKLPTSTSPAFHRSPSYSEIKITIFYNISDGLRRAHCVHGQRVDTITTRTSRLKCLPLCMVK